MSSHSHKGPDGQLIPNHLPGDTDPRTDGSMVPSRTELNEVAITEAVRVCNLLHDKFKGPNGDPSKHRDAYKQYYALAGILEVARRFDRTTGVAHMEPLRGLGGCREEMSNPTSHAAVS